MLQIDNVAVEVATAVYMHKAGLISKTYERIKLAHYGSTNPSISSKNLTLLRSLPCLTLM